MPPVVIDVQNADDWRDVVHRAVQAIVEGRIVAFPTETVYGLAASALDAAATTRLLEIKGRAEGHPMSLAIRSADSAVDYIPDLPPLARRLARRCWPGPVTLVLEDNHPDSLVKHLPPVVRSAVCPAGTVGLRVPAHPLIHEALRLLAGPLVLSSANRSGQPDCVTAQEVVQALGDDVPLVLDDGRSQFGQPSSVVRVDGNCFKMLRTGVVSEATLRRLASLIIVVVCTGNTCRSPMAEVLLRRRIADQVGCKIEELEDHGVIVASAGIAAMAGGRAAAEAVAAMAQRGLDLSQHETQPLSDRLVNYADVLLTMTRAHREAILSQWPQAAPRTLLLMPDETDVSDPIGGPRELYERCAQQIDAALGERLKELDLGLPPAAR